MIRPEEIEIVGTWVVVNGVVQGDEACERVHELSETYLELLGYSPEGGGWETLFRDPNDGRLWERWYPQSHMHGGGPPALKFLSDADARERYPNVFAETK